MAGIKFFADGERIELTDFIPIFHEWIQKQIIDNHLLIDCSRLQPSADGPGILLVAHQGNFGVDSNGDGIGLLYYRKQPAESLVDIVKPAVQGCRLLEDDPRIGAFSSRWTRRSLSRTIVSSLQTPTTLSSSHNCRAHFKRYSASRSSLLASATIQKNGSQFEQTLSYEGTL